MGIKSKIEWLDGGSTASPWYGCTKVSPGCANCYAEGWAKRTGKDIWGQSPRYCVKCGEKKPGEWCGECNQPTIVKTKRQLSKSFERECRKLNRMPVTVCDYSLNSPAAGIIRCGLRGDPHNHPWAGEMERGHWHDCVPVERRLKIFPSLCDWLDPEVPAEWLADMLRVIHECQNLDFLLLTKRPELFVQRIRMASATGQCEDFLSHGEAKGPTGHCHAHDWIVDGVSPKNIWVGTSIENNDYRKRVADLLRIPAVKRFLSLEPLLGPIDLNKHTWTKQELYAANSVGMGWSQTIDWVIVGGESGPGARPCNIEWIRHIVRQCKAAGVPCFVKQLGSRPTWRNNEDCVLTLKHPKGGDMSEWPEDLRVREMP